MNIIDISNFSTASFFMYLISSFVFFWIAPQKLKQAVLLVLSYAFYASYHFSHLGILLATTLIDFYFGQIIYNRRLEKKSVSIFVTTCVATNLGVLFFFKYSNFVFSSFLNITYQSILLPLGLSFFTLQSIGYILDISRGKLTPEKNFITYALFVSFFPQIIAGPIERASEIIPQYKKFFKISTINWPMVIYLFVYGFFKKYIVADNLAYVLSHINIDEKSSLILKHISLIFFFIRIYCDFSGYTNMARAIALLFTIDLKENFNFPLFANSPQDFWERWHMSLGRWIKNYFYTPLLIFFSNPYAAILIVFPIMGLWHGANVNFIFWGLAWAILIIGFKKLHLKKISPLNILSIFLMFNVSAVLMVFYKVKNFDELRNYLVLHLSTHGNEYLNLLWSFAFLPGFVLLYEFFLFLKNDHYYLLKKSFFYNSAFYLVMGIYYYLFSGVAAQQVFYLQY